MGVRLAVPQIPSTVRCRAVVWLLEEGKVVGSCSEKIMLCIDRLSNMASRDSSEGSVNMLWFQSPPTIMWSPVASQESRAAKKS